MRQIYPRLLFTILWVSLLDVGISYLYGEAPQNDQALIEHSTGEQLEADLPDVIRAKIIDTTRIVLEPRRRFSDPSTPKLINALGIYAKERLWNLPPIMTPQKVIASKAVKPKSHLAKFTAYPSLPDSLYYHALFGGQSNGTRGFLYLDGKQLGAKRTKRLGDYNSNSVRGELSYQHQDKNEISFDVDFKLKDLNWLSAANNHQRLRKDILFLHSDINWKQQIAETALTTLNVDAESFRLTHGEPNQSDEGNDVRLNFDAMIPMPFQNPIHAGDKVDVNPIHVGGRIEYFSANARADRESWASIIRLYVRDDFTLLGPFAISMGAEAASFRERNDSEEDLTRLQFNPYLAVTTNLGRRWIFRMDGMRTIHRPKLSSLYYESDYISLNPFLRPAKTWSGRVLLKYHRGRKLEIGISGFAKRVDDLLELERLTARDEQIGLTWLPTNIEARIYSAQVEVSAYATNRLALQLHYVHEFHYPLQGENIAYRPEDYVNLGFKYHISEDFRFALSGEFRGPRYVELAEKLESYCLLKPKLSKSIGLYINAFIGGTFAIGEYTLLHEVYTFSQNHLDFGVELKF